MTTEHTVLHAVVNVALVMIKKRITWSVLRATTLVDSALMVMVIPIAVTVRHRHRHRYRHPQPVAAFRLQQDSLLKMVIQWQCPNYK